MARQARWAKAESAEVFASPRAPRTESPHGVAMRAALPSAENPSRWRGKAEAHCPSHVGAPQPPSSGEFGSPSPSSFVGRRVFSARGGGSGPGGGGGRVRVVPRPARGAAGRTAGPPLSPAPGCRAEPEAGSAAAADRGRSAPRRGPGPRAPDHGRRSGRWGNHPGQAQCDQDQADAPGAVTSPFVVPVASMSDIS